MFSVAAASGHFALMLPDAAKWVCDRRAPAPSGFPLQKPPAEIPFDLKFPGVSDKRRPSPQPRPTALPSAALADGVSKEGHQHGSLIADHFFEFLRYRENFSIEPIIFFCFAVQFRIELTERERGNRSINYGAVIVPKSAPFIDSTTLKAYLSCITKPAAKASSVWRVRR